MARFTQASIERVKDASDVVEVVSAYTDLRRSGQRFTGLCPFHDERSPSFSVNATEKLYHCFGCGVGGDVIKFVEEKEGLSFAEAVEALGDRYGVEVEREEEDPRAEEQRRRRARLGELLERTAAFYASFLWDAAEAGKARDYLASRGLGEEALREFGVGYAPSAWDTVLKRGQSAGYALSELDAAGLLVKNKRGNPYDRFRSRIVFPIRDARGRVQGFGARAMTADQKPKYLNSPEGELYRKSRTLYAIERARPAIAKAGRAVAVEGYTDVLAAHQSGLTDVVGVMGTAITDQQVLELGRLTDQIVLALDADSAGRDAMVRANRAAEEKNVQLSVANMPAGKDPADLLTDSSGAGRQEMVEALSGAVPMMTFHVHNVIERSRRDTPSERERVLAEVTPLLAALHPDSIEGMELREFVARELRVEAAVIARRIQSVSSGEPSARSQDPPTRPSTREGQRSPLNAMERRERSLLAMAIAEPTYGLGFLKQLTPDHLSSPLLAQIRDWLVDHLDNPMKDLPRQDPEFVEIMTELVVGSEREPASREAMELNFLSLEKAMVDGEIERAAANGADPPVELQRRQADLSDRIAHFESGS